MEDADDNNLMRAMQIVDCVSAVEGDPQPGSELRSRRSGFRKSMKPFQIGCKAGEKSRCQRFGRFVGKIAPNLCKIRFGGLGQAERRRWADIFLPR